MRFTICNMDKNGTAAAVAAALGDGTRLLAYLVPPSEMALSMKKLPETPTVDDLCARHAVPDYTGRAIPGFLLLCLLEMCIGFAVDGCGRGGAINDMKFSPSLRADGSRRVARWMNVNHRSSTSVFRKFLEFFELV